MRRPVAAEHRFAAQSRSPLLRGGWQNRLFGTDFDWGEFEHRHSFLPPPLRGTPLINAGGEAFPILANTNFASQISNIKSP